MIVRSNSLIEEIKKKNSKLLLSERAEVRSYCLGHAISGGVAIASSRGVENYRSAYCVGGTSSIPIETVNLLV